MQLQKAYFAKIDMKTKKVGEHLTVQFNPADLSFNKTAQFAEIAIPGLDAPVLQFIRGGTETLTLELFFDATDLGMGQGAKGVAQDVYQFYELVKQDPDTHAPPICIFSWGGPPGEGSAGSQPVSDAPLYFTGVVESVDRKFVLFNPQGIPLRARVTVKMREYQTVEQMVSLLNSADHTKARVLKRRQRLDQVAAQEYDTPAEWRRIAVANNLDDPRRIPAGTILLVPPLKVESLTHGGEVDGN